MAYKSIRRYLSGVRRSWTRRGLLVPITYIFFGAFMLVLGFLPIFGEGLTFLTILLGGGGLTLCFGGTIMLLVAGDNVEWISKFYFDLALKAGYKASDEEVEGLKKSAWRFFQLTAIIVPVYSFFYVYGIYILFSHGLITSDDIPSFAFGLWTILLILFPINIHLNKRYGCDRLVQVANEYAMKHEEENEI